jgi:hypothetical protein
VLRSRHAPSPVVVGAFLAVASMGVAPRPAVGQTISTTPELAYDLGEVPSARSIGMSEALHALGVSTVALSLNPANMAVARVYHIETLGAFSPEAKRQTYGAAAVDSVLNTSRLAGGVQGSWSIIDPDGIHRTWTDLRAGIALPLGEYFAVGATGRWLRVEQSVGTGPFGHSAASDGTPGAPLLNTLTFDVGATATLGDSLRIGIAGHNLTNPGTGLAPTTGAAGIGYQAQEFALEADGLVDFTTYHRAQGRLMAGGELFLADRYALRAGWRYDGGTNVNSASFGLGYIDPSWGVELGVRRDLLSDHASTLAVLSLKYFYDATGASTPPSTPDAF